MSVESIITENLDIWTSAIKTKSASGRGGSSKLELYGIKKLRELILDLAVWGKLVPQDEVDQPANLTLKEQKAIRDQLIAQKKLKKTKPLAGLPEERTVSVLPKGWTWARIPEVLAFEEYALKRGPFGSSLKKSFFVEKGFKVYEQQHAINDDFYRGAYYITQQKFSELAAFEVKPKDLIISCSGTVGKVAEAPHDMERGVINQALLKISLNQDALLNDYFKVLFSAYFMKTETLTDLQGTAQKNMVSVDTLKNEPFPYPPVAEQERIVTRVAELMALCDQLESQSEASIEAHQTLVKSLLETLTNAKDANDLNESWQRISAHFDVLFTTEDSIDQLKQTILQLAVMGKLVKQDPNDEPSSKLLERIAAEKEQLIKDKKIKKQKPLPPVSEDEKPFSLPFNWSFCRLSDLEVSSGAGWSPQCLPTKREGDSWGVLKVSAVTWDVYKPEENKELPTHLEPRPELEVKSNDFLISRANTADLVAKAVVVPEFSPKKLMMSDKIVRFQFHENVNANYLNLVNNSMFSRNYYNSVAGGTSSSMKNVSREQIRSLVVPLPPSNEQIKILQKVEEISVFCEALKSKLRDSSKVKIHLADCLMKLEV